VTNNNNNNNNVRGCRNSCDWRVSWLARYRRRRTQNCSSCRQLVVVTGLQTGFTDHRATSVDHSVDQHHYTACARQTDGQRALSERLNGGDGWTGHRPDATTR